MPGTLVFPCPTSLHLHESKYKSEINKYIYINKASVCPCSLPLTVHCAEELEESTLTSRGMTMEEGFIFFWCVFFFVDIFCHYYRSLKQRNCLRHVLNTLRVVGSGLPPLVLPPLCGSVSLAGAMSWAPWAGRQAGTPLWC